MKTMKYNDDPAKIHEPNAMLVFDKDVTSSDLSEMVFMFLKSALEMDGYNLKYDLYQICEEIPKP